MLYYMASMAGVAETPDAALFRKTTSRNQELEARVEELERELNVWKLAHKNSEDQVNALKRNVAKLERSIGSFKVRSSPHGGHEVGLTDHPF
jgi:phage shock protein A